MINWCNHLLKNHLFPRRTLTFIHGLVMVDVGSIVYGVISCISCVFVFFVFIYIFVQSIHNRITIIITNKMVIIIIDNDRSICFKSSSFFFVSTLLQSLVVRRHFVREWDWWNYPFDWIRTNWRFERHKLQQSRHIWINHCWLLTKFWYFVAPPRESLLLCLNFRFPSHNWRMWARSIVVLFWFLLISNFWKTTFQRARSHYIRI